MESEKGQEQELLLHTCSGSVTDEEWEVLGRSVTKEITTSIRVHHVNNNKLKSLLIRTVRRNIFFSFRWRISCFLPEWRWEYEWKIVDFRPAAVEMSRKLHKKLTC